MKTRDTLPYDILQICTYPGVWEEYATIRHPEDRNIAEEKVAHGDGRFRIVSGNSPDWGQVIYS